MSYREVLVKVASRLGKASVYELYGQFTANIKLHPICCLCLLQGQSISTHANGEMGTHEDGKMYHYSCWNLQVAVRKYKE